VLYTVKTTAQQQVYSLRRTANDAGKQVYTLHCVQWLSNLVTSVNHVILHRSNSPTYYIPTYTTVYPRVQLTRGVMSSVLWLT